MRAAVDEWKTGHTVSMKGHSLNTTEKIHCRSASLLPLRGASYPAFCFDTCTELRQENQRRRTAHNEIMQKDPSAFRRRADEESASATVHNLNKVKVLLGDMHPVKDFKDIAKRKYTVSRRKEKDLQEQKEREEYHIKNMKPMEDFLQPDDKTSKRSTGYDHGHIRSMLKLDTYGPASSRAHSREREAGMLPETPSIDRYKKIDPRYQLRTGDSKGSRLGRGDSRDSSKMSTGSGQYNVEMHSLFHPSSSPLQSPSTLGKSGRGMAYSASATTLQGSVSTLFKGQAITERERLPVDPYLKRTHYFKTYTQGIQDKKTKRNLRKQQEDYRRQQTALARLEQQRIQDFEEHLVLAKFEA